MCHIIQSFTHFPLSASLYVTLFDKITDAKSWTSKTIANSNKDVNQIRIIIFDYPAMYNDRLYVPDYAISFYSFCRGINYFDT